MTNLVSVIGTVFIDCKGFARDSYNPYGRNLGAIQFVHGGVGRNVAENLANLNVPAAFVSTVDDSALGEEITKRLQAAGIALGHLKRTPNEGMGMWLALLNENGDLVGSISQMPNLTVLQSFLQQSASQIAAESSHLVLEVDLNEDISRQVLGEAEKSGKPVYGIPGNLDVVLKHRDLLGKLECFICNDIEAEKLLGEGLGGKDIEGKLDALVRYVEGASLRSMVITLGAEGSIYYDARTKKAGYQPVFPVQLVDSSGAGDAFFSGTVLGLVRGLTLGEAVVCGTKLAGWTIESKENNCPNLAEKMRQDELFQKFLVNS